MVSLMLAALASTSISYVSVRDESFGFMRKPQAITAATVIRGNDRRVPRLVRAAEQRAMPVPIAANLEISLNGHTPNELRSAYFHNYFTDSADRIIVRMRLKNGRTLSIVSNSQMPFMLPWVTYGLSPPLVTYDARLSRAIATLLPKSAPSYELLIGRGDFGWPRDHDPVDLRRVYSAEGLGGTCLRQYVNKHPGVTEQIHIEGDGSLPLQAQEQFLGDQYRAGRINIVENVAGQLQTYTWVTLRSKTASTDWIAGPNNLATILWRHSGATILGTEKPVVGGFMDYDDPCF